MTRDTVPIMALGAAMILALLLVAIELRDIKARLDRHRAELNGHHRSLVALKGAPMPPARVSPEWQERQRADGPPLLAANTLLGPATWADVLPPNHVLPWQVQAGDMIEPNGVLIPERPPNEWGWVHPSGDTLTMPSRDTMRLATTTAKLRPPTIAPPADVLDALHRSGHPMTRRELAEVLERSDWELTAELRDLIHAGRITVASTAHNTEAAYIPTTTGVPR